MDKLRSPGVAGVFLAIFAAFIAVLPPTSLVSRVLAVVAIAIIATWQAIALNNAKQDEDKRDRALRNLIAMTVPTPDPTGVGPAPRHLTEFQAVGLGAILSPHDGQRVLILESRGEETHDYAKQFRDVFVSAKWKVIGPKAAPVNQIVIDLQLSINNVIPAGGPKPAFMALRAGLDFIGVKSRQKFILDPYVGPNLIVLWVGAKTPEAEIPGMRPPLSIGPPIRK